MTTTHRSTLTHPTYYQAYLIRLWRESETSAWRVVVVYVPTGEKRLFKELGEALAFIEQRAAEPGQVDLS